MRIGAEEGVWENKASWRRGQVSGVRDRRPRHPLAGSLGETNPICPWAGLTIMLLQERSYGNLGWLARPGKQSQTAVAGRKSNCAQQTQFWWGQVSGVGGRPPRHPPAGLLCETNPICRAATGVDGAIHCGRNALRRHYERAFALREPNSRGVRENGALGLDCWRFAA